MDSVVEFKEDVERPTGGRRARAEKERKRKMKPGSFGKIAFPASPKKLAAVGVWQMHHSRLNSPMDAS